MIVASALYNSYIDREQIFPKWKLLSFNPVTDTWAKIIDGTYVQTPIDLTPYVTRIEYSFDRLQVTMADTPDLIFHPDGGVWATAIKQGRIIRLQEGFEGLAESEWLWTFSGTVEGTFAWSYQRAENISVSFSAFSRGNNQAFKRRNVTGQNYTVGTDWSVMFLNVVKDLMLLEDSEIVIPAPWGVHFDKNSNQIVNIPPWDAMEQLMIGIQQKPWFNGAGQLDSYSTTQSRTTLVLTDDRYLRRYEARAGGETLNKVILTYLSNTLSRVDGPDQVLGNATITAGFFTPQIDVDVYYSDERKTRSDNPRLVVKQSANAGLLSFCTEYLTKIDELHSVMTIEVSVWAPTLATAMLAVMLASSAIPDYVTTGGFIVSAGVTIPFGRIINAAATIAVLLIMMAIGTGVYEVWGTPYEMVYLEQQAIAMKAGTEFWEEREKNIRNDFISTLEQAQPIALNELHFEVMKENPRTIQLRYDPRIEPGDVIELAATNRVWVENVSRQITRGNTDNITMTVNGYRTVV